MGLIPAPLRSFFTMGLSDLLYAVERSIASLAGEIGELRAETKTEERLIDQRLARIEADLESLRALVRARDDRAQQKLKAGFSSAVNLISILSLLKIEGVVPPFPHHGFEITGEEAATLAHLIRRHRPKLVMELGSGSSTLLFAAAMRANGVGRVISVEHDREHMRRTAQLLEQAELSSWVQLVEAPLAETIVGDRAFQWYDLDPLLRTLSEKIDLLFVDGPPGKVQSLSRYPALPILLPHLSQKALVFVDDGGREDETRMVELWRELENVAFDTESLDFLPRAPILITMTGAEGRIAALRLAREEPTESGKTELFESRRSGTS